MGGGRCACEWGEGGASWVPLLLPLVLAGLAGLTGLAGLGHRPTKGMSHSHRTCSTTWSAGNARHIGASWKPPCLQREQAVWEVIRES